MTLKVEMPVAALLKVTCAKVIQTTDTTFFPMQMTVGAQYLQLCIFGGRFPLCYAKTAARKDKRTACFRCSRCGLLFADKRSASNHLASHLQSRATVEHVSRRLPEPLSPLPDSFFWKQCFEEEHERLPLSVNAGWLALQWKLLEFLQPVAWPCLWVPGTEIC